MEEKIIPIKDRKPDNDAIAALFLDPDAELRSNCRVCGKQVLGNIKALSDHFEACNGPG